MSALWVEVAGWIGALFILGSYTLLTTGRVKPYSRVYQWMNLVGALGFVINGAENRAYPLMTLNIIWVGLAIYSMKKRHRH